MLIWFTSKIEQFVTLIEAHLLKIMNEDESDAALHITF